MQRYWSGPVCYKYIRHLSGRGNLKVIHVGLYLSELLIVHLMLKSYQNIMLNCDCHVLHI